MSATASLLNRAKKTGPNSEATRTIILQAALQTFLEFGYDKVSMHKIAVAAAVARRTLYNQFPEGKEAVFHAATEHFWKSFPEFSWGEGEQHNLVVDLTAAASAIADFWQQKSAVAYLRLAISEVHRFPELMHFAGPKGTLPMMEQLMRYLEMQTQRDRLKVPSAELAMRQFFGLVCEPLLWPFVVGLEAQRSVRYREQAIGAAVAMFLKTYATRQPEP